MGAPRPPNSRRKAVPTIADLKLKIRRRKLPVPSCETTLSLEPLTLEPIVTRQTRKPSLKRKQVFAWTSSSGSQEETAPKRPKPRKKKTKKRKRKKPKAQVAARVLTPAECNVFFRIAQSRSDCGQLVYDQNRLVYDQNRLVYDQNRLVYDQNRLVYDQSRLVYDQNRLVYDQNRLVYDQNRLVYDQNRRARSKKH